MSNEQNLTGEQSLQIIHQMISKAKANITDNGVGWLLWGSMIFLASLASYFLVQFRYHNLFLAWNIFGIISVLLLLYSFTRKKKKVVRTYVDDVLRWVDISFTISLFVIIISINLLGNVDSGFGYLLMIYAILMLVQGGALRFRPLMIGAAMNWAGAIAVFYVNDYKYAMLITSAAVLIGYIIPGLILKARNKG